MKISSKFTLITTLVCATFSVEDLFSYGCTCPSVCASDGSNNYSKCYDGNSKSGCNSDCTCTSCDYLGALSSISFAAECQQSNALTFSTNSDSSIGEAITLDVSTAAPLAGNAPMRWGMSISTSNTSQLITTSNTTTTSLIDSPALYLGANNNQDYDIDSGVVYQNSGILLGNSGSDVNGTVNLYIHGVYNGIAQWSGNTITVNYAGAGNNTLTYTAGATGTQTDYPTNYDDDIIIYQS